MARNDELNNRNFLRIENMLGKADPILDKLALNSGGWVNPLNPGFNKALKTLVPMTSVEYDGTPLPTISASLYGTVDGWSLILAYNGYLHPDEIPNGAVLAIPDIAPLREELFRLTLRTGVVVTA